MSAFQAVLLDQDGCLVDSRPGIAWSYEQAFQQVGQPIPGPSIMQSFMGPPLVPNLRRYYGEILGYQGNLLNSFVEATRAAFRFSYDENGGLKMCRVYDGIPEMLAQMKECGLKLFLATSKPTKPATLLLQEQGLAPFFDGFYGSEPDGTRGDKGELIAHILRKEKLKKDAGVMVGDRKHDVIGAFQNTMRTAAAAWGYAPKGELRKAGPWRICRTPAEAAIAICTFKL